jgi:hypothetical protein
MSQAAFWRPRRQRVKKIHVWRERRASFGDLVMQHSSPFRWLEDRSPACQLIAVIDDATSRIYARFVEHDTTEENLRRFAGWLRRYGRPWAHRSLRACRIPRRPPFSSHLRNGILGNWESGHPGQKPHSEKRASQDLAHTAPGDIQSRFSFACMLKERR